MINYRSAGLVLLVIQLFIYTLFGYYNCSSYTNSAEFTFYQKGTTLVSSSAWEIGTLCNELTHDTQEAAVVLIEVAEKTEELKKKLLLFLIPVNYLSSSAAYWSDFVAYYLSHYKISAHSALPLYLRYCSLKIPL